MCGMRTSTAPPPQNPGVPPEASRRSSWRRPLSRLRALLAASAVLFIGVVVGSFAAANAASLGLGHWDLSTTDTVGAFISESDGRQVYCIDSVPPAPWSVTTGPTTVTFTDGTSSKTLGSDIYPTVRKPAAGAPEYRMGVSASCSRAGLGARFNLFETPGQQQQLANGTPAAVPDSAGTP